MADELQDQLRLECESEVDGSRLVKCYKSRGEMMLRIVLIDIFNCEHAVAGTLRRQRDYPAIQQHNPSLNNKLPRVNPAAKALVVGRAHGSCHAQRALNLSAIQRLRGGYIPSNASILLFQKRANHYCTP